MIEIRIYYECLEQGYNYILPIISEVVPKNVNLKLIKRPKTAFQLSNKGAISAVMSLTTPDVLIAGVINDIEIPLILIEFTEAVQAEDHELQRTYGAVAAYLGQMFYLKVSGHKQSEKPFGAAEYNPYSTPKMLQSQLGYKGFIIADWVTSEDIYNLSRDSQFPSCPPPIPLLQDTIHCAIKAFLKKEQTWFIRAILMLEMKPSCKSYRRLIDQATGAKRLLKSWRDRENRNDDRNRLRYFVQKDWIGAKINRFSHAMDPDRGVLTFISFIFSETHKIFGIYALVRKMKILKPKITDLSTLRMQLRVALEKDEWLKGKDNNLTKILALELIKVADDATSLQQEIDFQYFWEKHANEIIKNKVILTLAYFLDGMYLNHNGIKLTWDRRKLLGNSSNTFLKDLSNHLGFKINTLPIPIEQVLAEVDEDEVTYAIIHRVLQANGFKIVSVSYPGSQGGGAILPEPDKGKEQPREYPDIIAISPKNNTDVLLNESKGMFKQAEIEKDIAKILRYKNEPNYQVALKETLVVAKVIDQNENIRNIMIGVSFGANNKTTTTWQPDKVDFIFRITNRTRWAIGIFNQNLRDIITKIEGDTNFPTVYKISKKKENGQTSLFG